MKRFKVHCILLVVMFLLLGIGRATNAIDYDSIIRSWQSALSGMRTRYEQAKTFVKEEVIAPGINLLINSEHRVINENPYKDTVAEIRIALANELPIGEKEYRAKREPKVREALEKMLGRSLEGKTVPTIAFVGSGGGYRAMLCTTGFLGGAQKIGLLDAATYITALSGSTWALATWFASKMSIDEFRTYLAHRAEKTIYAVDMNGARRIANMFAAKLALKQPITMVDLFGGLLANRLLGMRGADRQMTYLSQQAETVQDGSWPYPIYTAVDGSEKVVHGTHWYEFTPHEIGSASFARYVPTWAYGRKFDAGRSTDFAPEQTLGFNMGTYGSAFAVHVGMAWEEIMQNSSDVLIKPLIEQYVITPLAGKRAFWAEVYNYMYNMPNIPNAYERLEIRETLKLVDGGLEYNLPYPPVSGERPERKADIIIFLDSSSGTLPNELIKAEAYARKKALKFPVINYAGIEKMTMSIFKDEDPSVPVVIYMPRISDAQLWQQSRHIAAYSVYDSITDFDMEKCTNEDGFCGTFSFEYTQEESKKIMDQMEFNMVVNKDQIIELINWVIDRKS